MEKNMQENFKKLEERVFDSLSNSDLERINYELSGIDGETLVSGVGGSSVVSEFAAKVLERKNHIITRNIEPRDFRYMDLNLYRNVLACSYSGNNYGVELSFLNNLKHYLLASRENTSRGITNLTYSCLDKEHSFISLGATLIPCSILLNYYLDNDIDRVMRGINKYDFSFDTSSDIFEIFSGIDTSTASKYLESTIVESGIGVAVVHDKYSYCHGRSTLAMGRDSVAIYLNTGTELDRVLLNELPKYHKDVVVIDSESSILGEYETLVKCMYLTKYFAEEKERDLSGVDYNPVVKKIYKYNGGV